MVRVVKFVVVGFVGIGVVEFVFRGIDVVFYVWYLLFVFWVVVLFICFVLVVVDVYMMVFVKGFDGEMMFFEFEEKMVSFSWGSGEEVIGVSSKIIFDNGNDGGSEGFFDDDRIN